MFEDGEWKNKIFMSGTASCEEVMQNILCRVRNSQRVPATCARALGICSDSVPPRRTAREINSGGAAEQSHCITG